LAAGVGNQAEICVESGSLLGFEDELAAADERLSLSEGEGNPVVVPQLVYESS